jgi:peptidoglycan/xylan/chitin deacetylase (PgdA/CDA1 family)
MIKLNDMNTKNKSMHMPECKNGLMIILILFIGLKLQAQTSEKNFQWPEGNKMSLSLTWDDARLSQVDSGTALLNRYNVKATFYVVPGTVEQRLDGWKKAVAAGHEIGNHSLTHPCTGNFPWSRSNALEDYTIDQMSKQLKEANAQINKLLGVTPKVFAYPCGQKFVGRGVNTHSYVPVVSRQFLSGRGWLDEGPNDPLFCDLAQITGMELDGKTFDQVLKLIKNASESGKWLVFAGHEMGGGGEQTTNLEVLEKLIQYAQDPANKIWLAPVGTVSKYIKEKRNPTAAR